MAEPTCLTCTKVTELAQAVTIGSQEEVQGALSKHFWFSEHEYRNGILCWLCWQQIEEFNRFYCEIEQLHVYKRGDIPSLFVDIKQEQEVHDDDGESVNVKMEAEDYEEFDQETADDIDPDLDQESSEEEESQPLKEAIYAFMKENITLSCSTCTKQFERFEDLRNHCLVQHGKRAYAFCCGNKYAQKSKLTSHIIFHVNPIKLQCNICTKQFRTRRALKNHGETAHVSAEEKTLQCSICPKKFAREKHLKLHEKYHRKLSEKKWHCASCDQYFPYESTLRQHNRNVHSIEGPPRLKSAYDEENDEDKGEGHQERVKKKMQDNELISQNVSLECDTCSKKFDTYENLQKHSAALHMKRATVSCCGTMFSQKSSIIDHIRFHVDPKQLSCDICSKQFRQLRALKNHKETAHATEDEKVLQCSMCPKKFTTQKHLRLHEKYHLKLSEKKWHCEVCDQYFAYESILKNHIKSVHSKDSLYVCHICAKEYHILSSYTSHVATHQESTQPKDKPPEEKLQCTECGSWIGKKGFRRHMLRHSGSQTCEQCGQECRSAMALRYHMAQHRNGDFGCTLCDKSFKQKLTLQEHMASHTGEVLYSCDFCEKTFNSHANRASHRKKMHPREWLEDKMRKGAATVGSRPEPALEGYAGFGFHRMD